MTDVSLKVYNGEDQSPVEDFTDEVPWERVEFGQKAYLGEATGSVFPLRDETGVISASGATRNIHTRNVMKVLHGSNTLWRGRRSPMTSTRGVQQADRAREHEIRADDYNVDLRGIIVDGWARPSETDKARVQALVAAYLSGNPRPSTNLNGSNWVSSSNLVTLPAKTYTRSSPLEVMQDIAAQAGKNFFPTVDNELWYDGFDSVVYTTPIKISDRPELNGAGGGTGSDPYCYAPQWNIGPAVEFNGQQWLSGARLYYGTGDNDYVAQSNPTAANINAHWEEIINDEASQNATEAATRLTAILRERQYQGLTYNVTIGPMPDSHVGSIKPGHLINIRARVIGAANSFISRRIVELRWTRPTPNEWFAHLTLGAPHRVFGKGRLGVKVSDGGTPGLYAAAIGTSMPTPVTIGTGVTGGTGRSLYALIYVTQGTSPVISAVTYSPNNDHTGNATALTLVESQEVDSFNQGILNLYKLDNPAAGTSTASVKATITGDGAIGIFYADTATIRDFVTAGSTGTSTSVSIAAQSGDLTLDLGGWVEMNASPVDAPTPGAGQTSQGTSTRDQSFGQADFGAGISSQSGGTSATWSFAASRAWYAGIFALVGNGPQNVGDTGNAGDSPDAAREDHTHGHGTFASGDYHSEYVREAILTTAGDLPYATGASTWTRRAIGGSNTILASDGTAPVWAHRSEASTGGGVTVQDEGTPLATTATTLNFVGDGVTASGAGATKTITVPGIATILVVIDGGGSTITTGIAGDATIDFTCEIQQVTMLADQSGSIVVDIWKDTYANYPPTVADTITASAKPTITTAVKSQDATLTGWTKTIAAGDTLRFNVDSVTSIQRLTLALKVRKT